jgi:hypothetical protein
MKKLWKVNIHLKDCSNSEYMVLAKDDVEARKKIEKVEKDAWKHCNYVYPGVLYCEITFLGKVEE